jgi:hexosaminidase
MGLFTGRPQLDPPTSPGRRPRAGRKAPPALLALALAVFACAGRAQASDILPAPALELPVQGAFRLDARTVIAAPAADPPALASARNLADLLARTRGLKLAVVEGAPPPGAPTITLRRAGAAGEAYGLDVTPQGLVIESQGDAGLFYGAISAWQLATPDSGRGPVVIPATRISDAPRFAWRGLMLDSARHMQSVAFIEDMLDRMARAKLNVLHWHLTDDQGWRLQIAKHPKLTEVGGWRVPAGAGAPDVDPKTGQPRRVGGFYTQAEVREIVAYAAARHITVVPEIEMPGHAQAALAAYPELGATIPPPGRVSPDWGVHTQLFNVDEATFRVLDDVLDEVMALFPSRYIHLGGDEAVKLAWKANPAVQARMQALFIPDENALQGWFTARMGHYLALHGRALVGWDEILQGGVSPGATVMSWRGIDGAIIAAKMGHDTVVAAAPTYYFDNRQGAGRDEPPGRGRVISLKDVYDFDPMPPILRWDERAHVLGVQGQLWSEHIRTEDRMARMAFPRALAIAETGWSPAGRKDWADFATRLRPEAAREQALGAIFGDLPWDSHPTPDPRSRTSQELRLCTEKVSLNLEDDAPASGPRAVFLTDIMNPCWIWPGADLSGVTRLDAEVGQVPFNFQIGDDIKKIVLRPPATAEGELEVRDGCAGPVLATLPLAPAARSRGVTRLSASIAGGPGAHDLCLSFTQRTVDPMWVLNRVTLASGREATHE